jgi:hypothetical protein
VFDEVGACRDNDAVFRSIARVATVLVIAPFLLAGSALAPLHVHEPGAGHSHALVHSHFEAHHFESDQPEGPEFEQDEARVVWLANTVLHQTTYHLDPGLPLIAADLANIPDVPSWSSTPSDDVAPAHGPPRRHPSFRGPPSFPA